MCKNNSQYGWSQKTQTGRTDQETKFNNMLYTRNTFNWKRNSWTKNQKMQNNILMQQEPKIKADVAILY